MGLIQKPGVVEYWSTDETYRTPFFGKRLTVDRFFFIILSNLHLVDNVQTNCDHFYKLRPFVDLLRNNFGT